MAVNKEGTGTVAQSHVVVSPQRILEERLIDVDLLHAVGVDGVHEVGVVHHEARGFLRELLARAVDEIDQTGIGEVFDVVHHGGP